MKRSAVITAALLVAAASAGGQVTRLEGGRMLDANYGIGTGGYNSVRQADGPIDGNLIVNRQVTGLGFRGGVPYTAPNELSLELPSAGIDSFLRRSTGVSDIVAGVPSYGLGAYLSPTRTVLGPSAIAAGYTLPGSSVPRSAYLPPDRARQLINAAVEPYAPILADVSEHRRINAALDPDANAASTAGLTGLRPQELDSGEAFRPTASTLFGVLSGKKEQELADELARADEALSDPARAAEARARVQARIEGRPAEADPLTGKEPSQPPAELEAPPQGPAAGGAAPGEDVFLDVLTLLNQIRQGQPEAAEDKPARPEKAPMPQDSSEEGEKEYQNLLSRRSVERMRDKVQIHSLTGRGKDQLNLHMAQGEKSLKAGKYYDAADSYLVATILDPSNPLPHVGAALAQFAANEPLSAALCLRQGMLRFPPLMELRVDVNGMLGKEVVAQRVAKLEERLAASEGEADPSLLFLAMFVRHSAGDDEQAKAHAKALLSRAGEDKIYRTYAGMVLTGKAPAVPGH